MNYYCSFVHVDDYFEKWTNDNYAVRTIVGSLVQSSADHSELQTF